MRFPRSILAGVTAFGLVAVVMTAPAAAEDKKDKGTDTAQQAGYGQGKTIVDVAASTGQFNTLLAAAKAAGLADALKGDGPLTVFAPTDAAFAKLPAGTVDELLKPENKDKLAAILKYHVVPAKATSKDVVKMDSVKTLSGQEVAIKTGGDTVMVGNATVTQADVQASNGVIHVIDTVLMPTK